MRLLIYLAVYLYSIPILFSQTVGGKPISEITVEYIIVEMDLYSSFSGKYRLSIDYGQEKKTSFKKDFTLKDGQEEMFFNSPMHAVNYICPFGYEVINVIKRDSDSDGDRYLLKRVKKQ